MRIFVCLLALGSLSLTHADPVALASGYRVDANITYLKADGVDLKLDVYAHWSNFRPGASTKQKTVVFFHGGGWMGGSKETSQLALLPYLNNGWVGVNVQYRLGGTALAPAAVEDTRCALRWVMSNAEKYGIDADRVVLTGRSAGGHLSLITGMLTSEAGMDARCPAGKGGPGTDRASATLPEMNVAAIVNWSGITDVNDLIEGTNATTYAVSWLGNQTNRQQIAEQVSPMNYVRKGLPPILTLHGDQDLVVPYEHAVRLHAALDDAGVPNQLHTLEGREHFVDYSAEDNREAYAVIDEFLGTHVN